MPLAVAAGQEMDLLKGYQHIYDLLDHAVDVSPENGAYYIEIDGSEKKLSYREQRTQALQILAALRERGVVRGEVVVADILQARDYYRLMWACFYGGFIFQTSGLKPPPFRR